MKVKRYTAEFSGVWDDFVMNSKNGNFHLTRKFLSYHKSRFEDCSLIVFGDKEEVITVIAANSIDKKIYSHLGLTYGGFVFSKKNMLTENMAAMDLVMDHFKSLGFTSLYYKTIPHIYHILPAEDDLYSFFLREAKLVCRHVNPVILPNANIEYQERRTRMIKKARNQNVEISKTVELADYWKIMEDLLTSYGTKPVHSLEEMKYLMTIFPENISLFGSFLDKQLIAGVLVFETPQVCKLQYIAANEIGKNTGALDLLIDFLINVEFSKKIIDFGTVTGDSGRYLSEGLSNQKEGFGARATIHNHYEIQLS